MYFRSLNLCNVAATDVCLGLQPSFWVVGFDCSQFHTLSGELLNVRKNFNLPMQWTVSSNWETGHKLMSVCTSKEESGHRIVEACDWLWVWGHLFGVSITTVCWYVQEFCAAAEMFKEMAAYGWGLPQCIGAIGGSHIPITAAQDYHCDYLNHKGWIHIITFKVMWMERDFSGMFSQDCLEACMMLGCWYCPHCGSLQAVEFTYQLTPRTLVGWMLATIS